MNITSAEEVVVDIQWNRMHAPTMVACTAIGSICIRVFTYPWALIKTHNQAIVGTGFPTTTKSTMNAIFNTDGFKGFYRGASTALIGFSFSQAGYMLTYEWTRYFLRQTSWNKYIPEDRISKSTVDRWSDAIGAMIAAILHTTLATPIDVVTQRQMLQSTHLQNKISKSSIHNYRNGWDGLNSILKTEGIRGLFRGYTATLGIFVPSSGIWWMIYGYLRGIILPYTDSKTKNFASILCGVLSGYTVAILINPMDIAKTRLQTQLKSQSPLTRRNILFLAAKVIATEGPFNAWTKGIGARLIHITIHSSLTTAAYEFSKEIAML